MLLGTICYIFSFLLLVQVNNGRCYILNIRYNVYYFPTKPILGMLEENNFCLICIYEKSHHIFYAVTF